MFHRKHHAVSTKEALGWSVAWIAMASLWNLGLYFLFGAEHALEFTAGYLIEKALAVDNIFVFNTPSHFLQVLEGDETNVRAVVARIASDPRHTDLQVIDARSVDERKFANWSMVARQLAGTSERDFRALGAARALELAERARDA